ncbi:MAG: signal peptidase I [Nitratireductor sp.]|nr:signal peptidase I [Nitratireductor sp.]
MTLHEQENSVTQNSTRKKEGGLGETVSIVIQALLLALVVRTLLFQPFTIPSGSMEPTLLIGDYLFVSKYSYGYSKYSLPFSPDLFDGRIWEGAPQRGQIAVFRLPTNPSIDYIKRVIGLPGDRVQVRESILYINDEPVKRVPAGMFKHPDGGPDVPMFLETLPNGVSYNVLESNPRSAGDNTRVFEVPPGHYFMMGDNRDNSLDSRFDVGFVPLENFIGPARAIFFSVAHDSHPLAIWNWPSEMRTDRLFKGL